MQAFSPLLSAYDNLSGHVRSPWSLCSSQSKHLFTQPLYHMALSSTCSDLTRPIWPRGDGLPLTLPGNTCPPKVSRGPMLGWGQSGLKLPPPQKSRTGSTNFSRMNLEKSECLCSLLNPPTSFLPSLQALATHTYDTNTQENTYEHSGQKQATS